MRKYAKGVMRSKTMWFSFLLVIFGAIFDNYSNLQSFLDPKIYGFGYIIIGIIVAILRFLTNKPLDDR